MASPSIVPINGFNFGRNLSLLNGAGSLGINVSSEVKPDVAAANGVNNTFFPLGNIPVEADTVYDPDTFPNFYGTSAASPHAAALAAVVLQAHGGPHSLTPQQVKTILQLTAFPHDLDPNFASGTATAANGGTVSIQISSDSEKPSLVPTLSITRPAKRYPTA